MVTHDGGGNRSALSFGCRLRALMILWAVIIVVEVIKIDVTGFGVIVPIVEGEARAAVIGPAEFETIPDRGESRSIQAVGKGATCLVIDD